MYEELKNRFNDNREPNSYKRIDATHPLSIYIGYNDKNYKSLAIVLKGRVEPVDSTKMISVDMSQRKDNEIYLSFNLQEDHMSDVFYKFCADIIDSTRNFVKIEPLQFVLDRWKRWISLFTKPRTALLTENEIKGLLGELIFLNTYLFGKYGYDRSLKSWLGVDKAHKDFEIDDTWYEVKCVRQNAITVKISSIEQLDSDSIGELIIVKLEPSNKEVINIITLNSYVLEISNKLDNNELEIFNNKLSEIGYTCDTEYDNYIYSKKGLDRYCIKDEFPTVKSKDLKDGIVRVSYELYLNKINNYKIVGE